MTGIHSEEESVIQQIITVADDQCGYCLEDGVRRIDPRRLTCGHSFCLLCLQDDFDRIKVVRCPICRKYQAANIKVEQLPSATGFSYQTVNEQGLYCETCHDKGRSAETHCMKCDASFCKEHIKAHNGLFPKHETITKTQWHELRPVRDSMFCEVHKRYPVTTGCKRCFKIGCLLCLSNDREKLCPVSKVMHEFDTLQNLVDQTKQEVKDSMAELQAKKDTLSNIEKELVGIAEELEKSKEATLSQLEAARQQQLLELNEKYDEMKEALLHKMHQSEAQVEEHSSLVVQYQAQVNRGLDIGKEITHSKSDVEVMKMRADFFTSANSVENLEEAHTLPVSSTLRMVDHAEPTVTEPNTELVGAPPSHYINLTSLKLQHITLQTRELTFSHSATSNSRTQVPKNCLSYSNDGNLMIFLSHRPHRSHVVTVASTKREELPELCFASLELAVPQLLLTCKGVKIKTQHIFTLGDNGEINHYVYLSKDGITPAHKLVECGNFQDAIRVIKGNISGLALAGGNIVMCSNTGEPELYVFGVEDFLGNSQLIDPEKVTQYRAYYGSRVITCQCASYGVQYCLCLYQFPSHQSHKIYSLVKVDVDKTTTKLTIVVGGSQRSVLCRLDEEIKDRTTCTHMYSWYDPEAHTKKPEKPVQVKTSIAAIETGTGAIIWRRYVKEEHIRHICYFNSYFYMLYDWGSLHLEIIEAETGKTLKEPMAVPVPHTISIKDFAVVEPESGIRKLMIRDTNDDIHVINMVNLVPTLTLEGRSSGRSKYVEYKPSLWEN